VSGEELTWEEIVNRVTIAGDYGKVRESAGAWQHALAQITQLRDAVGEVSRRSQSWQGSGGNAFRDHVGELAGALEQTVQSHQQVVTGLTACAGHLETAVRKIPIPSWMYDDVVRMRAGYGAGALDEVRPGQFWGGLVKFIRDQVPDDSQLETALRAGEEHMRLWLSDARAAYQELCQAYARELAGMPKGTLTPVPGVTLAGGGHTPAGTSGRETGTPTAPRPGTQPGNPQTFPGGSLQPPQPGLGQPPGAGTLPRDAGTDPGAGWNPGPGLPEPSLPQPWLPEPRLPSSGLESPGGLGGAGIGSGGLGSGGIGGGAGLSSIGPAVSLPSSAMMMGAVGTGAGVPPGRQGVAATGAGGRGSGPGASGMGMMPVGAGQANASTARAGTDTWLKEDDDYFGPDASTPDGVLDA
jgi:hypothetical protein